jgi:hypothetical protein
MRETPIKATVGPVTIGGNSFFSTEGVMKDKPISRRAHKLAVPKMAPYPSGQGNCVPSAAVGHIPFSYICPRPFVAIGMIAKLVPYFIESDHVIGRNRTRRYEPQRKSDQFQCNKESYRYGI